MTELKKELEVALDFQFQYLHQGENLTATKLLFYPPNNKVSMICADLEQGFYGAMKDMQEMAADGQVEEAKKKSETDSELEVDVPPKEVIAMLLMGQSTKFSVHIANFESLCLKKGICLLDGKEQMTKVLWDEMNYKDSQKAMGEYLANFLLR